MTPESPFRWNDPNTWPWIVYVWLLMVVAGWVAPLWRWLRKKQAVSWPIADGKIVSANVEPKKQLFGQMSSWDGKAAAYTAELNYSYSVGGQLYTGRLRKEFASEEEGKGFVRDLEGKPVVVSYNPQKPSTSTLPDDAVAALLNTRTPPRDPESFQPPVKEVPAWIKPLLWPLVLLSAVGLGLSLWIHIGAVAGRKVAPEPFFFALHAGLFVVWPPALFVAIRRVGNTPRKDFWKVLLRGLPFWPKAVMYTFFGYETVNFFTAFGQTAQGDSGPGESLAMWRLFSGGWMVFYSAALAVLYATAHHPTESTVEPPRQMKR